MRLFLTLCTLMALGLAKPQQGYNYGSGLSGTLTHSQSSQGGGFLSAPSNTQSSVAYGPLGAFQSASVGSLDGSSGGVAAAPQVSGHFGGGGGGGYCSGSASLNIGGKNYRVVFIKAPSSSNANVKLSAEYAPKEEKTVIYVLSKKDNQLEVNDIATPAPTVPSKPEVFFIKYKTEAEASHAQQQIQAEYDRIEGTSEHSDGGVAPAQSVVGILDGGALGSASSGSSQYAAGGGSSSGGSAALAATKMPQSATYLPPNGK
ncbi:GL26862 [Drosophila persimilis]|uniref:GL26862 n=1 Tax=Drosophila persimilis TaxID=7234 RepID=B4H2L6_DROPE|nr:GL26862 [Drosophila persimilis]